MTIKNSQDWHCLWVKRVKRHRTWRTCRFANIHHIQSHIANMPPNSLLVLYTNTDNVEYVYAAYSPFLKWVLLLHLITSSLPVLHGGCSQLACCPVSYESVRKTSRNFHGCSRKLLRSTTRDPCIAWMHWWVWEAPWMDGGESMLVIWILCLRNGPVDTTPGPSAICKLGISTRFFRLGFLREQGFKI